MEQQTLVNRRTYKNVKKMDRQQMEKFIAGVYSEGFNEGADAGGNVDFRIKLSEVLQSTKGVGPTLYNRIMTRAKEMEEVENEKSE